jgi:hypothetical protein
MLTSEARRMLESSGLTGFQFHPIRKTLIVDLPWHTWDLTAEQPAEYPDSGEPEDYILSRPHSPRLANELGDLWEIIVPFNVTVVRPSPIVDSYRDLHIDLTSWDGSDLLRGLEFGGILYSQRAKDWFAEQWGMYLDFDEFAAV